MKPRDVILEAIVRHLDGIGFPKEPILRDVQMTDFILSSLKDAGFQIVPVEPTSEMLKFARESASPGMEMFAHGILDAMSRAAKTN